MSSTTEQQYEEKQKVVVEEEPSKKKEEKEKEEEENGFELTREERGVLSAIEEINVIAKDLGIDNISFAPKLATKKHGDRPQLLIFVSFAEQGVTVIWSLDKFAGRFKEMKLIHAEWKKAKETNSINDFSVEAVVKSLGIHQNPFLEDETEYQSIGEGDFWLQPLSNMVEVTGVDAPLFDVRGNRMGQVSFCILPLDKNEGAGPWDETPELDPFVEEPKDLIGREIHFAVQIDAISLETEIAAKYKEVYVRYKINENDPTATTKHYSIDQFQPYGKDPNARYASNTDTQSFIKCSNERKYFAIEKASAEFVNYLLKGKIRVQVWGTIGVDLKLTK
jgi:hypothetical protein